MKKRFSLLLALVLVFSAGLTACGGGGADSEQVKVAKEFNACIAEMKADEVAKLCTEDFADEAGMFVGVIALMGAADENFSYEASDYKVIDEKDDTCAVTFTVKAKVAGEESEETGKLLFTKVDDKWLISGVE